METAYPPKSLLQLVSDVNAALAAEQNSGKAIRTALDLIQTELSLPFILFFLHDIDTDSLSLAEAEGLEPQDFRRIDRLSDTGVFRKVFDSGEIAEAVAASLPELIAGPQEGSLIAVPVRIGSQMRGVLAAFAQKPNGLEKDQVRDLLLLFSSAFAQTLRIDQMVRGERQKLREENLHLKNELKEKYDFTHIVGNSSAMRQVYEQVTQVARSNATVLLRGESGTGKELVANSIHYNSLRSKRPFLKVNCAALPDSLIESELFGHERGAFTGAEKLKKGRFELADGGTLFLDEIGDLPLQTQIKLLRVLQEREFERIGGTEAIKSNLRLITATNKNLEEAIAAGQFREDLYYRLNVFTIFLPPLRERKSDILLLAEHFLEKYEVEHNKRIRRISTPAIDMLMSYHFPGNVRELENAIERAVLVCDSNVIHCHHLPPTLQTAEVTDTVTDLSLSSAVAAFERDLIQDALKSNNGNVARAARALGSTQRILGYKINKYGIDTLRFRR
jgi:Nif-specific regulatory protein